MRLLSPSVTLILCALQLPAQNAIVSGTVLDSHGKAVAQATAFAYPEGAIGGIVPSALSDALGRFHISIHGVVWGKYEVSASKESAGFGGEPRIFPTPPNAPPVVVNLNARRPAVNVIIHLGEQSALLFGNVTDAATGRLLQSYTELRWARPRGLGQPFAMGGSGLVSGDFHVLVPSDTPFTLRVWSDGYEPWYYIGPQYSLSMKPGEKLRLDIRLKRIPER